MYYLVEYYNDEGKAVSKCFPPGYYKVAADYRKQLEENLNKGLIPKENTTWATLKAKYIQHKTAAGVTDSAKKQITLTLDRYQLLADIQTAKDVSVDSIEKYIIARQKPKERPTDANGTPVKAKGGEYKQVTSKYTLKKDLSNIRAFVHWGQKCKYFDSSIEVMMNKVSKRVINTLDNVQIKNLLIAARKKAYSRYMRCLLMLCTGLRPIDIQNLRWDNIDFERSRFTAGQQKTGKYMQDRKIPPYVLKQLTEYQTQCPDNEPRLFTDVFASRQFKQIANEAGLPKEIRYYDLKATFVTDIRKRKGIEVASDAVQHASLQTTRDWYANVTSDEVNEAVLSLSYLADLETSETP